MHLVTYHRSQVTFNCSPHITGTWAHRTFQLKELEIYEIPWRYFECFSAPCDFKKAVFLFLFFFYYYYFLLDFVVLTYCTLAPAHPPLFWPKKRNISLLIWLNWHTDIESLSFCEQCYHITLRGYSTLTSFVTVYAFTSKITTHWWQVRYVSYR